MADRIIAEAGSNKKTLVGVYCNIQAQRLPAKRKLNLYIEVVDAQGVYDFFAEVVHLESGSTIAHGVIDRVEVNDRLSPLELVLSVPASFSEYGAYEFRLMHGTGVVANRRFRVVAPTPTSVTPSLSSAEE
jgi:hypothetical protein